MKTAQQKEQVFLFTDGACTGNPGKGGLGVILRFGKFEKEIFEGYRLTTNNRMELLAVIRGLQALKSNQHPVVLVSDSQYVCHAIVKGWLMSWQRKGWKKVKNPDLWQAFLPLYREHTIQVQWVRGHAGHPENERCDRLAVLASQGSILNVDEGYERSKTGTGSPLLFS